MRAFYYDAENCELGRIQDFPDWTPEDARFYAMTLQIQEPNFDHLDWLLVWDEKPILGIEQFRSVYLLGGNDNFSGIDEQRIEAAFALAMRH